MALVYVLAASFLIALCQFCIHAKAKEQGKDELLMAIRFFLSAAICTVAYPVLQGSYHANPHSVFLAVLAGILQGFLMLYTRKALSLGSSNLVIAILNSSCVVPPIIMAALFGKDFQFRYCFLNMLGAASVVVGFFYAAKHEQEQQHTHASLKPMKHILALAFLFQVIFLLLLQWKALNFKPDLPPHSLLPFQGLAESLWFNAIMFATCALFQLSQAPALQSKLTLQEVGLFGIMGGLANGFSGLLLLEGIAKASTLIENALLYPLLSIGTVCFCQIWAKWLHNEKLAWKANSFFLLGILMSCPIEVL